MNARNFLLTTFCALVFSVPSYAQFNTIGTVNHKRIKTANPPKPQEAMTDSVTLADSLPEPIDSENVGNKQVFVSPMEHQDVTSLVSLPLKSIRIGSGFGMRMHPIYHKRMMHNGVDLSARYESVYSMFPGIVIRVGQDDRSGKFVTVRTGDYTISYCHLSIQNVYVNDFVNAGAILGISGSTGASTAPHLHLTTKKDGKAFNPTILLDYVSKFKEQESYLE